MMQIIGLTSRGLIKGARVTDRQTDGRTTVMAMAKAVAILFETTL
jgi:hypothetical protein